jgi:ABC-type transporter Mla subunit MlaD
MKQVLKLKTSQRESFRTISDFKTDIININRVVEKFDSRAKHLETLTNDLQQVSTKTHREMQLLGNSFPPI